LALLGILAVFLQHCRRKPDANDATPDPPAAIHHPADMKTAQSITLFFVCFALLLPGLAAIAEEETIPSPEETVERLYAEHLEGRGALVDVERRQFWLFMFGEELVQALESPHRGFDPLFFAQDHEIEDLEIREIDHDEVGNALVLVGFTNFGRPTRLVVAMHHTDHGYRIDNIVEPATGTSLVRDLAIDPAKP